MNMKQRLSLGNLRYFLGGRRNLHFSKGGGAGGDAQPPLSQQIRSLERIVGYPCSIAPPAVCG